MTISHCVFNFFSIFLKFLNQTVTKLSWNFKNFQKFSTAKFPFKHFFPSVSFFSPSTAARTNNFNLFSDNVDERNWNWELLRLFFSLHTANLLLINFLTCFFLLHVSIYFKFSRCFISLFSPSNRVSLSRFFDHFVCARVDNFYFGFFVNSFSVDFMVLHSSWGVLNTFKIDFLAIREALGVVNWRVIYGGWWNLRFPCKLNRDLK